MSSMLQLSEHRFQRNRLGGQAGQGGDTPLVGEGRQARGRDEEAPHDSGVHLPGLYLGISAIEGLERGQGHGHEA